MARASYGLPRTGENAQCVRPSPRLPLRTVPDPGSRPLPRSAGFRSADPDAEALDFAGMLAALKAWPGGAGDPISGASQTEGACRGCSRGRAWHHRCAKGVSAYGGVRGVGQVYRGFCVERLTWHTRPLTATARAKRPGQPGDRTHR